MGEGKDVAMGKCMCRMVGMGGSQLRCKVEKWQGEIASWTVWRPLSRGYCFGEPSGGNLDRGGPAVNYRA